MNNSDWQRRKANGFARGMGKLFPVFAERARNAEVRDVEGKRHIDFGSGIAVLDVIERENLCERALRIGERLVERLKGLQAAYPGRVGDVRGLGAQLRRRWSL